MHRIYPLINSWLEILGWLFSQKTDYFSFLPKDILADIFTYLSANDILAISKTCKRLNECASANIHWSRFFNHRFLSTGSYKNLWEEIIASHFLSDSNYHDLLGNDKLKLGDIIQQIIDHQYPQEATSFKAAGPQLCIIRGDSLNDTDRPIANRASRNYFAQNFKQSTGIGYTWLATKELEHQTLETYTAVIIYASHVNEVNQLLHLIQKNGDHTSLPFVFIVSFNNKMTAKDIPYPILKLIHMPRHRLAYLMTEQHKFFCYDSSFEKIWNEIYTSLSILEKTARKIENQLTIFQNAKNPTSVTLLRPS